MISSRIDTSNSNLIYSQFSHKTQLDFIECSCPNKLEERQRLIPLVAILWDSSICFSLQASLTKNLGASMVKTRVCFFARKKGESQFPSKCFFFVSLFFFFNSVYSEKIEKMGLCGLFLAKCQLNSIYSHASVLFQLCHVALP